jgi:tousled-like kinase
MIDRPLNCRCTDLDEKLKKSRSMPEKDCRVIIMQILSGLKYLNTPVDGEGPEPRRKAIIHYDLKPANM